MGSFFSKPKIPEPAFVAPPTPSMQDTTAKEAAEREAEKIREKRKKAQTIYTGPRGLEEAPATLKQKLG